MIGPELMKRMQEQMRLEDIYNVSIQKADGAFLAMDNDDVRETLDRLQKNTRKELLQLYLEREQAASAKRSLLEKDLAHIRREREKASSQRTEQITKLKADLHDVEENTEAKQNQLLRQHEKCMKEHLEKHKSLEAKFDEEILKLKQKYKELKETNKEG